MNPRISDNFAFLQEQFTHLTVASGGDKPKGAALPSTVAELKAKITELTDGLTSILPVGGKAAAAGAADDDDGVAALGVNPDAFKLRS